MGYCATAYFFYGQPIEIDYEQAEEIKDDIFINNKVCIIRTGHMETFEKALAILQSVCIASYEFNLASPILNETWNGILDRVIEHYKIKTTQPRGWYIGADYG